jgi:5-formyltetrahydrofolate cyclo-ligase
MHEHDEFNAPSSPPCLLHEFADELLPPPANPDWNTVRTLRKAKRAELIARRRALSVHDRQQYGESLLAHLLATLDLRRCAVLGFYWPIRGELDLREVARRHIEAGGTAALPVVVASHAPVEFWQWQPGTAMARGTWNIPVPAERRVLVPDALLIPLVGYDEAALATIYPQPHDIPMDLIVTERRALPFGRPTAAPAGR